MKIVNFGKVLSNIRKLKKVTQSGLVDLVDIATNGETGIDVVSISRWENNIIVPTHKRQLELVKSLGYDLKTLLDPSYLFLGQKELRSYLIDKIIVKTHWDFTANSYQFEDIETKKVVTGETNSYLFTTKANPVPLAHMSYHYENDAQKAGGQYIVLDSLHCNHAEVLLDIIAFLMHRVINNKLAGIVFKSESCNTPLSRFLKSLGFKFLGKEESKYIARLSYSDVLHNQIYFILACCYINRIEKFQVVTDSAA